MEQRFTSIERQTRIALPGGGFRIFYDEIESTETASRRDEESGEEIKETYPVYLYRVIDVKSLDRTEIIVALIRNNYTADDELAIQRQQDVKPVEYSTYSAYVEWCKAYADRIINGDTLETAKGIRIAQAGQYDASAEIRTFYVNGVAAWISPNKRNNLKSACESFKKDGVTSVPFMGLTIPIDTALEMISQIESYAGATTIITDNHIAAIAALTTVEDVLTYDFTTGYPQKLSF